MAKRIKIKGKAPSGLSKAQRMEKGLKSKWASQVRSLRKKDQHADVDPALEHVSNFIEPGEYIYNTKDRRKSYMGGQSKPSSTRKKLVKEGNRKFIGPRQFSSELAENRGRGNLNTPPSYRSYHRQLDREILERDDPTVDVHRSNAGRGGQLRGGLSPKVVAKLKAAAKKIATKPASQMTDRERKFIRNIDAMGHYLGNYRD